MPPESISQFLISLHVLKVMKSLNFELYYSPVGESTSDWSKACPYKSLNQFFILERQTQGRGRGKNEWLSSPYSGQLFATWKLLLPVFPHHTAAAKVGHLLFKAAQKSWPNALFALKAPNDLYVGSKKVGGVLIELIESPSLRIDSTEKKSAESAYSDSGTNLFVHIGLGLNLFSHPTKLTSSGSIAQLHDFQFEHLEHFLIAWTQNLMTCFDQKALSPTQQMDLIQMLNKFDLLKEPYTRIDSEGNLYQGERLIKWTEL